MRKRYAYKEESTEDVVINLTPLIDVVFVILIIFILIAPLLEFDRVELAQTSNQSQQNASFEQSPLSIHVHADNSVWHNNRCVSLDELIAILKINYAANPHLIPQLFQDKRATFESYQNVKNSIEKVGFEHLDVILKPG